MANYAKGKGLTPLIIFRGGATRTNEIVYAPAANYKDPTDDVYDFVLSNGDRDPRNYQNNGGKLSYTKAESAKAVSDEKPRKKDK